MSVTLPANLAVQAPMKWWQALAIVIPTVTLVGLYYQETLTEEKKKTQMRFKAPMGREPEPLYRQRVKKTGQTEIPGIPPEGMDALEAFED